MDTLMIGLLVVILIYVVYKNIYIFKRSKFSKEYMQLYREMFLNPQEDYDKILAYLEKEKDKEFYNKTLLLRIYCELVLDKEYKESLNQLELNSIYTQKGKFDNKLTNLNSDAFIWILLIEFQLKKKEDIESLDSLVNQLTSIPSMDTRLEYAMILNFAKQLKGEDGISFYKEFISGNYPNYKYEKQMVGLYKRFGEAILAYFKEDVSEYDYDLNGFTKTIVGHSFMEQLGLYDTYKDPDMKKVEEKDEE